MHDFPKCVYFEHSENISKNSMLLFYWKLFIKDEIMLTSACHKHIFINEIFRFHVFDWKT